MKVAIYGRKIKVDFLEVVQKLFQFFDEKQVEVVIYEPFYRYIYNTTQFKPTVSAFFNQPKELKTDIEFMFSIGGDGTFLETIYFVRDKQIPIVGINSGRLGFLADISQENVIPALEQIFSGNFEITERSLLQLQTSNNLFGDFNYALNEVTILKKDSSSMINIQTFVNDEFLNNYWVDGIIISTPTGSTAYSLSVGGPIITPDSKNFIINPIAPHTLTVRPLIVPDDNELSFVVKGRSNIFLATLDYRSAFFDSSVELKVKKADFTIKTIRFADRSFFATLREKLMWGADFIPKFKEKD